MTREESLDEGPLTAAAAEAWSELCGAEDDDEQPPEEHAGYASLAGLGARKPNKKPVIMLDPEVAEKAAQVMEINAGQLVVNPGQAAHGFALLGLDPLGPDEDELPEPLAEFEEAEEEDVEADAAVAEWAARIGETGEDEVNEEEPDQEELDQEQVEEIAGETLSDEAGDDEVEREAEFGAEPSPDETGDLDEPMTPPEDEYELTVEAVEAADEQPAIDDEPVLEQAIVDQAWLDWARALLEPQAAADEAPFASEADDCFAPAEPEPLDHPVDEAAPAGPELPRHELRLMIAQLSRPRTSQAPRFRVVLRRLYRWVRQRLA